MVYKISILIGTPANYDDRQHEFMPFQSFKQKLEIAKTIPHSHGVEPVFLLGLGIDGPGGGVDTGQRLSPVGTRPERGFLPLVKAIL